MKRNCIRILANIPTQQVATADPSVLITIKDLARRYHVSVRTIHDWKGARIGYYKIGGALRFHPEECDEDLKAFYVPSRIRSSSSQ
jgi:hypothetical protein